MDELDIEFVLSDNSVNSYGYVIKTSGIQTERYEKNAVMFFNHRDYNEPIGKWKIRFDGDRLLGKPCFAKNDEQAQSIKKKVEAGVINGTSIGVRPLELSQKPKDLVAGQTRATVTKCELFEVSFVGVPANANAVRAVRLYANGSGMEIPKLKQQNNHENMDEIALKLGLKSDATKEQILAAIELSNKPATPVVPVVTTPQEPAAGENLNIDVLIKLGMTNGHINKDNEAHFRTLAASNYKSVLALVGEPVATDTAQKPTEPTETTTPVPVTLSAVLQGLKGISTAETPKESLAEKFLRLSKDNPEELARIEREDKAHFDELNLAYINS